MIVPALTLSLALAATPSNLGAHILDPDNAATQKVLAACPAVALFVLPNSMALASVNSLLSSCPNTAVVLRANLADKYLVSADPVQSANSYWNRLNGQLVPYLGLDLWVEGPNGIDNVPDWTGGDAAATDWLAQFTSTLADRIHDGGFKPVVGAIPSGSPKLASELGAGAQNPFKATATAMKAKSYPWAWSYHAFSNSLLHSSSAEAATTLRYRQIRAECELQDVPVFLTAVGQASPGWLKRGTTASAYLEWLDWLDARLAEDGAVAALYQFGGTSGTPAGYELSTLADALAAMLASTEARDAGVDGPGRDGGGTAPPPAGRDAGSHGGWLPPGGGGTPVPERHGCSSAGAGSGTTLAAAAFACLLLRRRRG